MHEELRLLKKQKRISSRLYTHITWGGQAVGGFCHQVTQLFSWEGMWVRACSRMFSSTAALAAVPAASHGGCIACMAFVPWLISLCLPALLTNFSNTWQHAVECWFCQSYKYFVYKETYVIEAFQIWILHFQAWVLLSVSGSVGLAE